MADSSGQPDERAIRPYFRWTFRPRSRVQWALWWARFVPLIGPLSLAGARGIRRHVDDAIPPRWAQDFGGRKVLVVGSGPSLDRVDQAFLDGFDTRIYINFALARSRLQDSDYFFTTDLSPARDFCAAKGMEPFLTLGPERCLFAPVYFDQWPDLTPAGRDLFTVLRPDGAQWTAQRLARVPIPVILRYFPRQPDWRHYALLPAGRTLPVVQHTSALSAVLFAAQCGAREIGLIGCDFSAGRAASVGTAQVAAGRSTFSGAAAEFRQIAAFLDRSGISATNHSWLV